MFAIPCDMTTCASSRAGALYDMLAQSGHMSTLAAPGGYLS